MMAGILTEKVVPEPTSLRTEISPPIILARRLEIARPRPVPPYRRVVELIGLRKRLEETFQLFGRHADSGIR